MADAWGGSWGTSWATSWTTSATPAAAEPVPGGGPPRRSYERTGRSVSRAELDKAVHALRALSQRAQGIKKRKSRERIEEVAAEASRTLGLLEDAGIAAPLLSDLTLAMQAAASAKQSAAVMRNLTKIETDIRAMLAYLAQQADDEEAMALLLTMI